MVAIEIHAQGPSLLEALTADAPQVLQGAEGAFTCRWSQPIPVGLEVYRRQIREQAALSQGDLAQAAAAQQLFGVREVLVAGQKSDGIQPAVFRRPLARVAQQGDGQQRRVQQLLREQGELLLELSLPTLDFFGTGATRPPALPGLSIKRAVVLAAGRLHALIVGASSQADAARASICWVSRSLAWAGVGARIRS